MPRKGIMLFGVAVMLATFCALPTWPATANSLQQVQPPVPQPVPQPMPQDLASEAMATVTIDNKKIEYKITTGRMPGMDMSGKAKGNLFYIAYTRKTDTKAASRPLTFSFNGGPGASSSYVHMGAFGPRRVLMDDDGKTLPKPAKLVENDCSILDMTDLVFIDPISTGYSRADNAKEAKLFHGLEEDTFSVGEFIRAYVAKHDRGASPVYIAGESYGTTRAASLSAYLQQKGGVKLAGIMLISTVLDFKTISFGANNDLPNVLFLPAYTASALHHKKLDGNQATLLDEAEKFANGPYAEALSKGKGLTEEERKDMAKKVAKLTGLSEEYVLKVNLRINAGAFRSELLRDAKEVIGRYDARVSAKAGGGGKGGKGGGGDPSNSLTSAAYTECLKNYLENDLHCKTDLKYTMLAQVNPWNFGTARNKATVVPRLRSALEKDPAFRVFVACGYCDLATPFAAAKYSIANMGPQPLKDRVTFAYYEGGHMMYTVRQSHKKLREDLVKFIADRNAAEPAPAAQTRLLELLTPYLRRDPLALQLCPIPMAMGRS